MDYFTDLLDMFLSIDRGNYLRLRRVRERSDLIKNILICVLKMNGGLTGLARHEGEKLMTELSFVGELTL